MDKGFIETYFNFSNIKVDAFVEATKETLYMTLVSMFFVLILGILVGLMLFYFEKNDKPIFKFGYNIVSIISNTFRSVPFIILMILLFPVVKALIGTMLGPSAAVPALVLSAAPFYARLVDIAFREVDKGVLEASEAMGANKFQIIFKVLIPESLPALISGVTVTSITMIGFTAMAGAVGAGGLGTLAYQAGFMGNDYSIIMLSTLLILLIVFIIQWLGDILVKLVDKRDSSTSTISKKKIGLGFGLIVAAIIGLSLVVGGQSGPNQKVIKTKNATNKIIVGASATPHAEILEQAKPLLKEKGYDLEIKVFQDFVLPNKALAEKELDANYFQHIPYLDKEIKDKHYDFVNAGAIHLEKMAFYSKSVKKVSEVKDGATILVSNSQTDWGRVITMLQDAGLVKVKEGTNLVEATFDDIAENPKNLKFKYDIDPAIMTTTYENNEGDLIAINANFAENIGLNPEKDGVIVEGDNSPYANVIAARTEDKDSEKIKTLVEVLHSDEIKAFIKEKWNGTISVVD
ncbi:MAG TPA: hypothetical protein DIS85_12650 [Vagococcus sp.]|uniref:Methionine ABC transporter substrate-binding protein n=1 Tax=Vagococcus fluvialis bH819 TaxID=1255619 RepID=A0A1X6WQM2_9ENTE|nr:Methionine ABC transporter substrate-binding protein [Vagococcus fluvialis bH819]HCM90739.1 hypothetical protein [Vagococcus sp.]